MELERLDTVLSPFAEADRYGADLEVVLRIVTDKERRDFPVYRRRNRRRLSTTGLEDSTVALLRVLHAIEHARQHLPIAEPAKGDPESRLVALHQQGVITNEEVERALAKIQHSRQ